MLPQHYLPYHTQCEVISELNCLKFIFHILKTSSEWTYYYDNIKSCNSYKLYILSFYIYLHTYTHTFIYFKIERELKHNLTYSSLSKYFEKMVIVDLTRVIRSFHEILVNRSACNLMEDYGVTNLSFNITEVIGAAIVWLVELTVDLERYITWQDFK